MKNRVSLIRNNRAFVIESIEKDDSVLRIIPQPVFSITKWEAKLLYDALKELKPREEKLFAVKYPKNIHTFTIFIVFSHYEGVCISIVNVFHGAEDSFQTSLEEWLSLLETFVNE